MSAVRSVFLVVCVRVLACGGNVDVVDPGSDAASPVGCGSDNQIRICERADILDEQCATKGLPPEGYGCSSIRQVPDACVSLHPECNNWIDWCCPERADAPYKSPSADGVD